MKDSDRNVCSSCCLVFYNGFVTRLPIETVSYAIMCFGAHNCVISVLQLAR